MKRTHGARVSGPGAFSFRGKRDFPAGRRAGNAHAHRAAGRLRARRFSFGRPSGKRDEAGLPCRNRAGRENTPPMGRSGRLRRSLCIRRKPFALDSGRFTSRYFKKLLKSREQVSKMHSDRFDSPKNGIFTYDRPPRGTPPGSLLLRRITRAGRQHVKGPGPLLP